MHAHVHVRRADASARISARSRCWTYGAAVEPVPHRCILLMTNARPVIEADRAVDRIEDAKIVADYSRLAEEAVFVHEVHS